MNTRSIAGFAFLRVLAISLLAVAPAFSAPTASASWEEPRLMDLRPGGTFRIGVKTIRWTADLNRDGLIDAGEVEVRADTDAGWSPADAQAYEHLVKWRLLLELDPAPSHVYRRVGERALRVFVDSPPDVRPGDKRPAAIFFFGGSWNVGWQGEFMAYTEYLAKRGMVCFRVDYRVGFRDGAEGRDLRAVDDARASLRWVIANAERFGVDPARLVTIGESAGGHLAIAAALASGLDPADDVGSDPALAPHVKAIVSAFPVSETGDRRISPWHLVNPSMPPLFLTWGTKDVFAEKLDKFVAHARELGIAPTVHVEPEARHGFILFARYQAESLARIDAFLTGLGILRVGEKITPGPDFTRRQAELLSAYRSRHAGS
ncbi:MAG: alpha/beta hydrolase [Opitutaceae bacterium]|jgi:acetyl esterase/lipase|nr:alpha/beta hydrolase [Opitutaceae bacterium]